MRMNESWLAKCILSLTLSIALRVCVWQFWNRWTLLYCYYCWCCGCASSSNHEICCLSCLRACEWVSVCFQVWRVSVNFEVNTSWLPPMSIKQMYRLHATCSLQWLFYLCSSVSKLHTRNHSSESMSECIDCIEWCGGFGIVCNE